MVNHFRTLLLNKGAVYPVPEFGEFIPTGFRPQGVESPEELVRGIILGAQTERNVLEFSATTNFRMMYDISEIRAIMDDIDPRISFDPRTNIVDSINSEDIIQLPAPDITWGALSRSKTLAAMSRTSGKHAQRIIDLSNRIAEVRQDSHRVALFAAILCLRVDERLRA
jgi:hypothetical protein